MPVQIKEQGGDRIIEVRTTGKLAASDYIQFVPEFERLKKQDGKLRVLFDLHDFHGWTAGGLWEDVKFEGKHFSAIERLAVIGETKWQEGMTRFCKPFTTAQIRFFKPDQAAVARRWLAVQPRHTVAVAVFNTHHEAEAAVKAFQEAGYDMKKLSIVGQDYQTEQHVAGYYNTGNRMKAWGKLGSFWGSIWGLLFGVAFFFIPGIGPVLMAGPLVASLVAALEGALIIGGLSALGAALYSVGIPKNSVLKYETDTKAGKYLLLMTATMEEIERAENEILKYNPPEDFSLHGPQSTAEGKEKPSPALAESAIGTAR